MKIFPAPQQAAAQIETPEQAALAQALEKSLSLAINSHQSGKIEDAETLYRGILEVQPQHPEANYQLGRLAVQLSQAEAGLTHFAIALKAQQNEERYWLGYVDAMMEANEIQTAAELLALGRQHGLHGDGVELLSIQLEMRFRINQPIHDTQSPAGVVQAAVDANNDKSSVRFKVSPSSKAAGKTPPIPREMNKLANLFKEGRLPESEALAHLLTQRLPLHGFYWKVLGTAIQLQGRHEQALMPLQTAARLWPEDAETHCNLGLVLKDLGRQTEAEASFRQALAIEPADFNTNNSMGLLRKVQCRFVEAEIHYRRALASRPKFVMVHSNLGNVLDELGRSAEAEESYRKAIEIEPDFAEGHHNLGCLLRTQGRLMDAEACFRRGLEINPENIDNHTSLGIALQEQGKLVEAEACIRLALKLRPDDVVANSGLLFALSHSEAMDEVSLFDEHCRFGERFEAPLRVLWQAHGNLRDPERYLKVGFVSGDLRSHAVASFIEPVLERLVGYTCLSLHAYSNYAQEDAVSLRLRRHFKHWHAIADFSDAALAEKIRADGIDILIDLSGHTGCHRLLTFARRPAPVQVSWIGYPGTTGLSSMDYYLSDRFFLPQGQFDSQFTEKLVNLPALAPFLPKSDAPTVNNLPALGNGFVTFGSFNRPNKLSRAVIAVWADLLRALPTSRMVLGAMAKKGQYDTLIGWFTDEGISLERLSFHSRASIEDYLALHHQVDICLDAFPYNGSTTSLHALWMGVPTLTIAGSTPAGRAGAWILGHVGLTEFVAMDAAAFVNKGTSWADRLSELARIRAGLRERFNQSALGQPALIAAGLERALRIMWQRWCHGLPAASFEVSRADIEQARQEAGV